VGQVNHKRGDDEDKNRVLFAMAMASHWVLTGLLLLNGNVSVAIWMEGPYFPLTLLLPESVDTLPTMVVVVELTTSRLRW